MITLLLYPHMAERKVSGLSLFIRALITSPRLQSWAHLNLITIKVLIKISHQVLKQFSKGIEGTANILSIALQMFIYIVWRLDLLKQLASLARPRKTQEAIIAPYLLGGQLKQALGLHHSSTSPSTGYFCIVSLHSTDIDHKSMP